MPEEGIFEERLALPRAVERDVAALRARAVAMDRLRDLCLLVAGEDGRVTQDRTLPVSASAVSSFGQDGDGELYVVSDDGEVFRVEQA